MNLRDLQYFTTTAHELHFGRAAELCNVSQPTLSMQLKKLEETLGVQLFERSNKQVMLTPIGEILAARAERVLRDVGDMRAIAKTAQAPDSGELHFGIFPTLAPYLLPGLMPQLKEHFPRLDVLLTEEKTPELISKLAAGSLDCALLAIPVEHAQLTHEPCFTEPFLLAVSAQHRLAKRRSVRLDDMRSETMLLLEEGHCLRAQALDVCETIGMGEANNFRATSLETLRYMVAASDSVVTLMPKLAAHANDPQMRYIPFASPVPSRQIGLYWRRSSARGALFQSLARLIAHHFARV